MKNVLLPNRTDFLGSNFVAKLAVFLQCKFNNHNVYYDKNMLYYDSMYLKPIIDSCNEKSSCSDNLIEYDEKTNEANIRVLQGKTVENIKEDLISYFSKNYKQNFLNIITEIANKRNYKLPWNDNKNIICIHLRLYDDHWHEGADFKDFNGTGSSLYIRELIESNNIKSFNKRNIVEYCKKNNYLDSITYAKGSENADTQVAIDISKLENMFNNLKKVYPEKEIHVVTKVTKNPNNNKYIDLCKKYNIQLHSGDDYDYDLWLLINSDVLVLSKSTYSLVAGYYHKGNTIYYPLWGHFASTGLFTKYDQSAWKHYI